MDQSWETLELLNTQSRLIEKVFEITKKIQKALSETNLDTFSSELDHRLALFAHVLEIQGKVSSYLSDLQKKGELSAEISQAIKRNRGILQQILEVDSQCGILGEEVKKILAERVNSIRTTRKIKKSYEINVRKAKVRFCDQHV
jgi:hypothetical protein